MRLIISFEDQKPKVYEVEEESFTIGRSSKNDIQVDSDGISRQHLRIRVSESNFYVTDLGSSNGSFINNERLKPNVEIVWLTFLPVQLGHKVSISISEEGKAISQKQDSTSEIQKKNLDRMIDRAPRNLHPVRKRKTVKKVEEQGVGISLVTIVTLLGVGALVYFHFHTRSVMEKTKEAAADKVKTSGNFLNQDLLKKVSSVIQQPKCQGQVESFYCLQLKLNSDKKEGAILLGDALYLAVDIKNKVLNIELDSDFPGFSDDEKRLYTMSFLLFNDELKLPMKDANIQNVYLIDIFNEKPIHVLKVPAVTILKFRSSDIKTIYGRLKAKDNTTFNRYLLPGMEMASAK